MKPTHALGLPLLLLAASLSGCGEESSASGEPGSSLPVYAAMARGEVDVDAGHISIYPSQTGRLTSVSAKLGEHVQAGQVMAHIESPALNSAADLARAEVDAASARLDAARTALETGQRQFARLQAAQAADAASPLAVDEAQATTRNLSAQERIAAAELAAARLRAGMARAIVAALVVRAPVAGEVVQRSARVFQQVFAEAREPLFVLVPDGSRIVRAEVHEDYADSVQVGARAEVVIDGPAESVYPARVLRVASALRRTTVNVDDAGGIDGSVLDCELAVEAPKLRVGQRVLVRFPRSGA